MKTTDQIAAEAARKAFTDEKYYTITTCDTIQIQLTETDLVAIIEAAVEEATMDVPLDVQLALRVLLNHVEEPPSWHNCKATVTRWLDSLPSRAKPLGKYQKSIK